MAERHKGTIHERWALLRFSVVGRRFEIPSRYRHLERVAVRWARWDLGQVYLVDAKSSTVLCRLFPLDRTANADGVRRTLEPIGTTTMPSAARSEPGIAPLLEKLMADYRSSGLPPAYVPMVDRSERDPNGGGIP